MEKTYDTTWVRMLLVPERSFVGDTLDAYMLCLKKLLTWQYGASEVYEYSRVYVIVCVCACVCVCLSDGDGVVDSASLKVWEPPTKASVLHLRPIAISPQPKLVNGNAVRSESWNTNLIVYWDNLQSIGMGRRIHETRKSVFLRLGIHNRRYVVVCIYVCSCREVQILRMVRMWGSR